MEAVVRIRFRIEPASLQCCFNCVLVPIRNGVRDVINAGGSNSRWCVSRNYERVAVAENQIALGSCIPDHFGAEKDK